MAKKTKLIRRKIEQEIKQKTNYAFYNEKKYFSRYYLG